jgi:hypothetical protein
LWPPIGRSSRCPSAERDPEPVGHWCEIEFRQLAGTAGVAQVE